MYYHRAKALFFNGYGQATNLLHVLQRHSLSSSVGNCITTTSIQHSFAVNYLINSCGLSPERAISAAKCLKFESSDKPDTVISLFKNHGFSQSQISVLIRKMPKVLLLGPQKNLLPKLQFFYSKGISASDLAKALTLNPVVLDRSLENKIIPNYNFLKTFLHSDDECINAFKKSPGIFGGCHSTHISHNILVLRQCGVPESNIVFMLCSQGYSLLRRPDKFEEIVQVVRKMGIMPSSIAFVLAIQIMISMSKSTWKSKLELYERWGWSEDVILRAFVKSPSCMKLSEEKLMAVMNFYVNVMGWESLRVARSPVLLSLSLKSRIIPRCAVLQFLLSKGLLKKFCGISPLLLSTEPYFLKKFVTPYSEVAPDLLELYQAKLNMSD